MSSVEQLTAVDRLSEPNPSGSDSFSSCGGGPTWDLLGDLMIDLGGNNGNTVTDQGPLKMQNSSVSENLAPTSAKPDSDKGLTLKMKIKRKSKNEEKHEIVTPEMEKFRLLSGPSVKLEDADPAHVPQAKKSRLDKSAVRHTSSGSSSGHSSSSVGGKRDAWANTTTVGTGVEPDCLGPCDSGSSISLDGIVWLETDTGVLVVNVSWRGRTYVGTLLDSSRHDFAPPTSTSTSSSTSTVNGQNSNPVDPDASNSNGGSRWCHQQLQAQQQALQLNGQQHHHHHSLAYQHAQQHQGGRGGRGNRRRGGRPTARQLPLANGGGGGGGSTGSSSGSELPHIRCPEPGCDKRFAQLQALKWHSINQHCLARPGHRQQHRSNLREEKSLDGSSVFKVPQQANKAASGSGVVTVSKTCPVPAGLPTPSISFKAIQPKSTSSGCAGRASSTAGRRSADPVSPAYSDISDEGGAPVLEREDEQQHLHHGHHRDRQQHQSLSRSLSAVEVSRAKSLPPKEQQQQKAASAKSQSVPSATAPAAAGSDTAAESPAAAAPPRTPLSSGVPQSKPSLGRSPSDSEAAAAATAAPAATAALPKAPSSAPVSSTATPTRPVLQPSPRRRPSQSPSASSASSPRFQQQQQHHHHHHQQNPGAAAAAVAASSGFDPYRLLSAGGVQQSPYQLPGLEALSQYAAAAAAMSSGRQQQQQQQQQHSQHLQQQQQQQLHQQHKIHELSRNSSPKASPPLAQFGPAGVPQHPPNRHHQLHQQQHHLASLHHHQQQQHRGQPPPPHHLMEQFNLPFSLASQMMPGGPPPAHYLQPK